MQKPLKKKSLHLKKFTLQKEKKKVHKNSCGDENWRAMINITIETSYQIKKKRRESSKLNQKLRENVRDGIVFIS